MTNRFRKILVIISAVLIAVGLAFICIYVNNIQFRGEIILTGSCNDVQIVTVSPFNRSRTNIDDENPVSGYFKEIYVVSDCEAQTLISIHYKNQPDVKLSTTEIQPGKYKLQAPGLSFSQKIGAFVKYNQKSLIKVLILFLIVSFFAFRIRRISHFIKNGINTLIDKFYYYKTIISKNLRRIGFSILISALVYPFLLFVPEINLSVLYNISHFGAFVISYQFFFIPICGLFLYKYLKNIWSFLAFWIILFAMFFLISPHVFAGNFGFYCFFHSFITEANQNNFFTNLILPDIGYLAVLPRFIYGLSSIVNPSMTNVIAITSIFTLIIYSWIFSRLLSVKLNFIWLDERLAFVFTIILALFPVFSLVPGLGFPLPATDVAYYGILLIIVFLFSVDYFSKFNTYLAGLISFVFVISKAHMLVLIPVIIIALVYALYKKRKNIIIYSSICLLGLVIQAVFCFYSLQNFGNTTEVAQASFSVGEMGMLNQIAFSLVYFIKSYAYIFITFVDLTERFTLLWLILIFLFIIFLFVLAVLNIRRGTNSRISVWFLSCNFVAYLSALFYALTLSAADTPDADFFSCFIKQVDVNLIRYTIGVHTVLLFGTLPFVIYMLGKSLEVHQRKAKRVVYPLLIIMTFFALFFNKAFVAFPEFWSLTKGDNWSREWSKLIHQFDKDEFYIPIVFFPEYKQYVKTENLDIIAEYLPYNESSFGLNKAIPVRTIIVLLKAESETTEIPCKMQTYCCGHKEHEVNSLYKHEKNFRFVVFDCNENIITDSIVFFNIDNELVLLDTYIRVIGETTLNK
ncbi:MAG: hypothetical protein C0596_12870 [Marinilabiliales bacterium]|nr:MAG: hypothetical protein C0596_12870 [Marinilabiliales bacterium]